LAIETSPDVGAWYLELQTTVDAACGAQPPKDVTVAVDVDPYQLL